jgi:hypothetical protein
MQSQRPYIAAKPVIPPVCSLFSFQGAKYRLSDVTETLLMMLCIRSVESQRPDALIKDEKAVALVAPMFWKC